LKLPSLLAQFLYKYKRLSLPGIGIFRLDPAAVIPHEHNKEMHVPAQGIEFRAVSSHEVDDELIEFIKSHTGKMKSLAQADLESYLTLGTELLNIGKPFYLEGIGTLTKDREGRFEFTPGEYSVIRTDEGGMEKPEKQARQRHAQDEPGPESVSGPIGGRKILLTLAILAGLVVIGWGGYLMYRKNTSGQGQTGTAVSNPSSVPNADTAQRLLTRIDSSRLHSASAPARSMGDSVQYKYIILRTHNKERALRRYNQLLSFELKPYMESVDSTFFKVYFTFPAMTKDTSHIKDSLYRVYAHPVTIER
jgi:hypothetical protein